MMKTGTFTRFSRLLKHKSKGTTCRRSAAVKPSRPRVEVSCDAPGCRCLKAVGGGGAQPQKVHLQIIQVYCIYTHIKIYTHAVHDLPCPAHSTSMLELHHSIQKPGINSPSLYRQIIIDTTSNEKEKKQNKKNRHNSRHCIVHNRSAVKTQHLLSSVC